MQVINRDGHDRALCTDPNPLHQPQQRIRKVTQFHNVMKFTGLVHNHPSGDPTPSRADIDMTRTIIDTAKPLGITVHDHIIIGKAGHVSMKGLRLI